MEKQLEAEALGEFSSDYFYQNNGEKCEKRDSLKILLARKLFPQLHNYLSTSLNSRFILETAMLAILSA